LARSATAHLTVDDAAQSQRVLDRARSLLADRFHLSHATLRVESGANHGCDEMKW
jgi:cobalt-zinc-cadmium efflux system protein